VLVVSCPCALSLATPTALAAGTDRLLRQGVLVTGAQTLETLHRASHIVFDKTGTLTYGRPVLQQTTTLGLMEQEFCLQVAAALDAASAHRWRAPSCRRPAQRTLRLAAQVRTGRRQPCRKWPGGAWKACCTTACTGSAMPALWRN
jgi:magnesium-transporting ATPase (P-type)